jgi:two-component system phosphate regulon response regulator PhoB
MPAGRTTVLVVQNDQPTQDLLADVLESEGYAVERAATGAAGLERLDHAEVDLVLLDFSLPDLNGLELCQRIRARPGTSRLPVIMLSGWSGESREVAGYAAGANEYVAKPFDIETLLALVRRYCSPPTG